MYLTIREYKATSGWVGAQSYTNGVYINISISIIKYRYNLNIYIYIYIVIKSDIRTETYKRFKLRKLNLDTRIHGIRTYCSKTDLFIIWLQFDDNSIIM